MKWLAVLFVALLTGCSDEAPTRAPGGTTVTPAPEPGTVSRCTDGETRKCSVTHKMDDGTIDCFESTQRCMGGVWAECGAPVDAGS